MYLHNFFASLRSLHCNTRKVSNASFHFTKCFTRDRDDSVCVSICVPVFVFLNMAISVSVHQNCVFFRDIRLNCSPYATFIGEFNLNPCVQCES